MDALLTQGSTFIKNIEDTTCIRFVDKVDTDTDWMDIFTTGADGCFANARFNIY